MVVIGGVVLWHGSRVATAEARDVAAAEVRTTALSLVVPLTAADLSSARRGGVALLDEIARPQVASGELTSVHLWARRSDGAAEVVWTSEPAASTMVEQVAHPVPMFGTTDVDIHEVARGDYPTRSLPAPLYEAYAGFTDRSGVPYVLEVYRAVQQQSEIRRQLLEDWLPISLGGVIVLGLATLPLSLVLARRMVRADREQRAVTRAALDATSAEHRRIAGALHEQTVQDLAAVTLLVGALRHEELSPVARDHLDRIEDIVAGDVRHLRALVEDGSQTDEYPDLRAAVDAWLDHLGLAGLAGEHGIDDGLALADPTIDIAHRIIKEATRNVAKHAGARSLSVRANRRDDVLVVTVVDDGQGFDADARQTGAGLRLVRAAVRAWDGSYDVESVPGEGTRVHVMLPLGGAHSRE